MKIRIKGNTIRYRLSKIEVEEFSNKGYLEECTEFRSASFKYALCAAKDLQQLDADMSQNKITVYFPEHLKNEWFTSEQVGYKNSINTPSGESMLLLVEKDFACIDNVDEDQSQNYPNPNAVC